ncbi:MAG TPA: FAD-dependent monooxygenase [Ramlibacter sp.]|nr:FAD-dependent monooxygenase [Ramlibacter sp.]
MTKQVLIAGGGLGGLAAAVACTRAGWDARLYEQAAQFSEFGAGLQLGPNATRILHGWGLERELSAVAAFPQQLRVRSANDGTQLGLLRLGPAFTSRYGAPYATVHRADLQGLLLGAARQAGVHLKLSSRVTAVLPSADAVGLRLGDHLTVEGDALVGADGLWSAVRPHVCSDGPPTPTGHLAYRCVATQRDLPALVRSPDVTVWLGPRLHVVAYPVWCGEGLNVVAIVQGRAPGAAEDWDQAAIAADLQAAMGRQCAPLQDLVRAMPGWRLWALHDRAPVASAGEMARGLVALLGDAAHPMRPYFAQGAGMAIEDAAELGRAMALAAHSGIEVPLALRRYALNRWQRCARVQARSRRNGRIFHATGLVQRGRDLSLRLLGERLLDQPWLYR